MRQLICFLLVLSLCMSMTCTAYATAPSPGESGPVVSPDGGSGKWPSFWGDNPKTGDIILFWVLIMVVSLLALGAVYVIYRKKFKK